MSDLPEHSPKEIQNLCGGKNIPLPEPLLEEYQQVRSLTDKGTPGYTKSEKSDGWELGNMKYDVYKTPDDREFVVMKEYKTPEFEKYSYGLFKTTVPSRTFTIDPDHPYEIHLNYRDGRQHWETFKPEKLDEKTLQNGGIIKGTDIRLSTSFENRDGSTGVHATATFDAMSGSNIVHTNVRSFRQDLEANGRGATLEEFSSWFDPKRESIPNYIERLWTGVQVPNLKYCNWKEVK